MERLDTLALALQSTYVNVIFLCSGFFATFLSPLTSNAAQLGFPRTASPIP
jgi:hypothetical protein